eukprot:g4620.t1
MPTHKRSAKPPLNPKSSKASRQMDSQHKKKDFYGDAMFRFQNSNPFDVKRKGNEVVVNGLRGEILRIFPMSKTAFHVSFRQSDAEPSVLDNSWSLVDKNGGHGWNGVQRRDLPHAQFMHLDHKSHFVVKTAEVTARIRGDGDFGFEWFQVGDKESFASDMPIGAYIYEKNKATHYMKKEKVEYFYGIGESSGQLNKAGRRFRLKATDALGYDAAMSDPLYKHCPFFIVYNPEKKVAYALLYDQLCEGVLDFGEISAFRGNFRYYQSNNGAIDYVFVVSESNSPEPIASVVSQVSHLLGSPIIPPKYALGYLGSTMTYTDALDAQNRLRSFGEKCENFEIPCSGFHLSSGYTLDEEGCRNVFTWDRNRIPDPKGMFSDFHSRGMKVLPNIKPWLLKGSHPEYSSVAEQGGFLVDPSKSKGEETASKAAEDIFWKGGPGTFADGSYIDFTSQAGVNWWKKSLTEQLLHYGADAAWNDNNEYEVFNDKVVTCALNVGRERESSPNPEGVPVALIGRAIQPLLMGRASYEAVQEFRPNLRPLVVSRSGALGSHRYCSQTWSGDNVTSWKSLQYNIPMSLSLGLSGWVGTGFDVGGFAGGEPTAELMLRWVSGMFFFCFPKLEF